MDFRVLGPLGIYEDGVALPIGTGKQRTFVALLIVHRDEVVSTDRAIDAIWGEHPPASAANSIHVYVSHLRKVLGDDRVVTRGRGYAIVIDGRELDADVFEARLAEARELRRRGEVAAAAETLASALSLWHGPALADFLYEDFAQNEIARLEELRLTALEERIDADIERGHAASVVPELEGLVGEHPHRERLRGQLMLALYRSGRQADALAVYRDGRELLVSELGLEPDPSLQELERAILRQDPALVVPREEADANGNRGRRRRAGLTVVLGAVLLLVAGVAALVRQLSDEEDRVSISPNSVAAVAVREPRIVGAVASGVDPVAVVVGEGAVWVANSGDRTVSRIDPEGLEEATVGIGSDVSDIAVGFGSLWVANGNDGSVARIDAETTGRIATLTFGGTDSLVPEPVFYVAAGPGGMWLTRGNRLLRVDPSTNAVDLSVRIEPPLGLAVGGGSIWVTTRIGHVLRLDPASGKRLATFSLPSAAVEPVFGSGALWVVVPDLGAAVWSLNPDTGEPTAAASSGSSDIAWGAGALWSASEGAVVRLSPAGRVVSRTPLGADPAALAVGDGLVWLAFGAST